MTWQILKIVIKVYAAVLLVAICGFVGANWFGLIGALFFVPTDSAAQVQNWSHTGWWIGTIFAGIGVATGKLRFLNGASVTTTDTRPGRATDSDANRPEPTREETHQLDKSGFRPTGVVRGAVFFGLVGGMLGAVFGGSLLICWFSVAYSPFAPRGWGSSVRAEYRSESVRRRPILATNHPVAVNLMLFPMALGASAGAFAGGVGAALGKIRHR